MSNRSLFLSCLVFIFIGSPALVANPLVSIPSGDMSCSVTASSHMNAALPDPSKPPPVGATKKPDGPAYAIKSAVIDRVGKLEHITLTLGDGNVTEAWNLLETGMTMVEKATGPTKFIYELPKGSPLRNLYCPTMLDFDAESVSWINAQTFTGKINYQGKPTLHYQMGITLPAAVGPPINVVYQAWVDPKTLALIAIDDGYYLYEPSFSDPPSEPLVMPARFHKDLQEYQHANAPLRHL